MYESGLQFGIARQMIVWVSRFVVVSVDELCIIVICIILINLGTINAVQEGTEAIYATKFKNFK